MSVGTMPYKRRTEGAVLGKRLVGGIYRLLVSIGDGLTEKCIADVLGDLVPGFAGLCEVQQFAAQHPLELNAAVTQK